ncbi:MAG: prolipoprotein diacylglyceryl transferase [Synergistaceae bacterium]|nr:prolipoprotein diacylglyceryl transferase [Synergistaceae bacterium]
MYPTLFTIAGFRVDTYSVIWFIALWLAIVWVTNRLELYDIDEDQARKIMSVSFLFMLFGAHAPEYFINWKTYVNEPSLVFDCNRGGLHEAGALIGAFVSAFVLSVINKKVSFAKLCEAAAIPAMLSIAVGRWGCFFNGCCVGHRTKFFTAVHFPADKVGVLRHPVQIYYSLAAFAIVLGLLFVEKRIKRYRPLSESHSIIAPLALISYSLMRLLVDATRMRRDLVGRIFSEWNYKAMAFIVIPLCCVWLAYGLRRSKNKNS